MPTSVMVVVTSFVPKVTSETVVVPGLLSTTWYCSLPSTRPSLTAARLITRLGIGLSVPVYVSVPVLVLKLRSVRAPIAAFTAAAKFA